MRVVCYIAYEEIELCRSLHQELPETACTVDLPQANFVQIAA